MKDKIEEAAYAELSEALDGVPPGEIEPHFRNRPEPAYLFSRVDVDRAAPELQRTHRAYLSALFERADRACRHEFILAGNDPGGSYLSCGEPIDWHTSPNGDREGLFTLNRHRWFFDLARAAYLAGDDHYAEILAAQMSHWIVSCPAPRDGERHFHDYSPWKVLNGAIRIADHWLPSYHIVRDSGGFDVDSHLLFLHSVLEHARVLSEHVFDPTHNHTVKEMGALLAIALYFPEFRESEDWKRLAVETLETCVIEQVLEDGVHFEATPAYHKVTMEWLLVPYLHAKRAGVSFSQTFEMSVARMARFSWASSLPDGTTAPIGDSDRNALERWSSDRGYMSRLVHSALENVPVPVRAGPDPDLLWMTGRMNVDASSDAPVLPTAYRSGGFFVMTDRWTQSSADEQSATYLIIRNGPMNHGHAHADLLSFLLYHDGMLWLTDTGKYTYNETPRRKYLKGTRAHNTVAIDWEDQAPYRDRMSFARVPEWENAAWIETEDLVFYEGSHDGYTRLPKPVRHTRQIAWLVGEGWVVVDRFTGEGVHVYDQYFHFPAIEGVSLDQLAGKPGPLCRFSRGDTGLSISWLGESPGDASLQRSWISPAYGERHESTVLRYRLEAAAPATIVTWMSFTDELEVALEETTDGSLSVRLGSDGGRRLRISSGHAALESCLPGGKK